MRRKVTKKVTKPALSWILCMTLTVAMAFYTTGCNGKADETSRDSTEAVARADGEEVGEGERQFSFSITDLEGETVSLTVRTDKAVVGEALQELGLISGEESEYGLYVTSVNGVTLDYEADGAYWAFYINDEYAQAGVDATDIAEGDSYSFKAEKQ